MGLKLAHPNVPEGVMIKKEVIEFKVHGQNLKSLLYRDVNRLKSPAIFITPCLGPYPVMEQFLARQFVQCGFAVFITSFMPKEPFKKMVNDIKIHDRTYRLSVEGIKKLLKLTHRMDFIDHQNMGLMGMSLGGIFTALNARLHSHFKASVIVAGGGGNEVILGQSQNPLIKLMRETRMKNLNLSMKEYEQLISDHIRWDALKLTQKVNADSIYMLISTKDTHVPTASQVKTWQEFGKPRAEFVSVGHYPLMFLATTYYLSRIRNFFIHRLQECL